MKKKAVEYEGVTIKLNAEMVSLTDMWKACGAEKGNIPAEWLKLPQTEEFIESLSNRLKTEKSRIAKVKRGGKTPGAYAHWQVGLAYAKFLSDEFYAWANKVLRTSV